MKNSWFPILMIVTLLGLLVLLATLQYQWLGRISQAEQIRLEARLKDDTKRFAEEFNNEIQTIYLLFHLTKDNWNSFNQRKEIWNEKTDYKNLIKDFHFVNSKNNVEPLRFDNQSGTFVKTVWNDELKQINKKYADSYGLDKFSQDGSVLIIPIHKGENHENLRKNEKVITVKRADGKLLTENIIGPMIDKIDPKNLINELRKPEKEGILIIRLDEKIIKKEILPTLTKKYFAQNDGGSYKVSITDSNNSSVFQTHNENLEKSDAQVKLFDINTNGFIFLPRKNNIPLLNDSTKNRVVLKNSVSSTSIRTTSKSVGKGGILDIDILDNDKTNIRVGEKFFSKERGVWTLSVQHIDGSLEQFIGNTRRRNLAISFGILSLLAVSIILIFLSSQRAKLLAQKQMDFVSSVSHEFRTPLAVIYSAGENLSDGVIAEREKISNYGGLIKREGKKLSGMVEQILEFAGANSGKRKYDFRNVKIQNVIDEAIAECQTFIDENDFVLEKDVSESLPNIYVDEKALTLAIQNLINNSLKYSNGSKWLKISSTYDGGNLKVLIADKGIGISAKDKKQIFEPFYRAENVVDEQISGNGLGLSLVKQIIDAHGGKIEVESVLGKGSKFIINLPLNS